MNLPSGKESILRVLGGFGGVGVFQGMVFLRGTGLF
jgi:hypothetical protein